jgi:hypothetical protein
LKRTPSSNTGSPPGGVNTVTSTNLIISGTDTYPSVHAVIDRTMNNVVGEKHILYVDVDVEPNKVWGLSCEITLSPKNVLL